MDKKQSLKFISACTSHFSTLQRKFHDKGDSVRRAEVEKILEAWIKAFENVKESDAYRMLDALISGICKIPEWDEWDTFPAYVTNWCKSNPIRTHVDGIKTYKCRYCWDMNWVTVLMPKVVRSLERQIVEIKESELSQEERTSVCNELFSDYRNLCKDKGLPTQTSVICFCDKAQKQVDLKAQRGDAVKVRFDPKRMPQSKGTGPMLFYEAAIDFFENRDRLENEEFQQSEQVDG